MSANESKFGGANRKIGEARFGKTNVSIIMNATLLEPEIAPGQASQKENPIEPEIDFEEIRAFPDSEFETSLKIAHILDQLVPQQHWGINE